VQINKLDDVPRFDDCGTMFDLRINVGVGWPIGVTTVTFPNLRRIEALGPPPRQPPARRRRGKDNGLMIIVDEGVVSFNFPQLQQVIGPVSLVMRGPRQSQTRSLLLPKIKLVTGDVIIQTGSTMPLHTLEFATGADAVNIGGRLELSGDWPSDIGPPPGAPSRSLIFGTWGWAERESRGG